MKLTYPQAHLTWKAWFGGAKEAREGKKDKEE